MKKTERKTRRKGVMPRHQKILIGAAIAFLLYSLLGFVVLPTVLQNVLEKKLSENLKRQVSIENIQVNPYLLQIAVSNFQVQNPARATQLLAFNQLFIDLEAISLIKKGLIVKSVVLNSPKVYIARYKDLTYNFSDIPTGEKKEKKADTKPLLFSINNIEILNGAITFLDDPKDTTHRVRNLNINIPFISNLAHRVETHVEPSLSAVIDDTPLTLTGRTIPFHDTRSTVFDIRATKINIPAYLAYLPQTGDLTLSSGFLDISATLGFEILPDNRPGITLTGDFSLKEIKVAASDNEAYMSIPLVDIRLANSRPLEKDFHFSQISLAEPEFLVRREKDGDILPLALLPDNPEQPSPEPKTSGHRSDLKLVVDEVAVSGGTLRFIDLANAEKFATTLKPIEIAISDLSTLEGNGATCTVSMQSEARESITVNGRLALNPLKVDLQAELQNLLVPRFSPYFNEIVTVQVLEADLDLAAELHYAITDTGSTVNADNIAATLSSIAVQDKDNSKLLSIPRFAIRDSSWNPQERRITIGSLAGSDGELHLVRKKDGLVILNELLHPRENGPDETAPSEQTDASPPWLLTLEKVGLDQFSIVFQDHVPAEPATLLIDNIHLAAEKISTAENSEGNFELSLRLDHKGALEVKGPITVSPLTTSMAVMLAGLQVKTVQPYFADKVDLVISEGSVSFDGQLDVSRTDDDKMATLLKGKAGVADFASFDPVAGEDFLKFKNLDLENLVYESSSYLLTIKEISWEDFYNRIVVFDSGSLNLAAVLNNEDDSAEETPKDESSEKTETGSLLIRIDSVNLDNGKVEFLDRNITPNYASSFSELSGNITGLSSQADTMAEVKISGRLDDHAPLLITGRVNPLRHDFFADLYIDFSNIELSPTSPYTGKFIGYTVSKGKLSLDLEYQVEGTKISGKNKAFLDQFTLGDTVESPDALNLPLNLAIALLKNRRGEITLNVPVRGDLSDPEFSIGGVVFKAIVNLIAKAATSPFALLGAFLPEGEDLQYIDFESGSARIQEKYHERLDAIAKALFERPGLKMDIRGSADAGAERPVLHDKKFEQLLKIEKLKILTKQKETPPDLEEIVIEPEEYETLLEKAYKEAEFDKPKNFLGLNKKLPPEEMEKLLHENIKVTDDELRLLAIERANGVKSYLVEAGPVEPDRIFIVEPTLSQETEGFKRAEMVIK